MLYEQLLHPKINFFSEPSHAHPAVRRGPNVSRMGVHVEIRPSAPRAAPTATRPTPPTTTSTSSWPPTPWRPSGPSAEPLSASTDTSGLAEAATGRRRSGSGSFPVGATSARARPSSLVLLHGACRARLLSGGGAPARGGGEGRRWAAGGAGWAPASGQVQRGRRAVLGSGQRSLPASARSRSCPARGEGGHQPVVLSPRRIVRRRRRHGWYRRSSGQLP